MDVKVGRTQFKLLAISHAEDHVNRSTVKNSGSTNPCSLVILFCETAPSIHPRKDERGVATPGGLEVKASHLPLLLRWKIVFDLKNASASNQIIPL